MKKAILITVTAFFSTIAFGQRYYTDISLGFQTGKNDQGVPEKKAEFESNGVYKFYFWGASRSQPFPKDGQEQLEQQTSLTFGLGHIWDLKENIKFVGAAGATYMFSPVFGSFPKVNSSFWGATICLKLINEESFDFKVKPSFNIKSKSNSNDWNMNLLTIDGDFKKFIGQIFLTGLDYKMESIVQSEKQIQGQQFKNARQSEIRKSFYPFVGAHYRWGKSTFQCGTLILGPTFENTTFKYSQNSQPPNSSGSNNPIGFRVRLILELNN